MPIWKLESTTKESEDWEGSIYRGPAVVRAPDEKGARLRAIRAFGIAVPKRPGGSTPLPPWNDPTLVRCTRFENATYPEDGPTKVLEPPHYDDE